MSAQALEAFLARLYTDDALRSAFVAQPAAIARAAGLDEEAVHALARIDHEGLALAAESFAMKRAAHGDKRRSSGLLRRLLRMPRRWFRSGTTAAIVNPRS